MSFLWGRRTQRSKISLENILVWRRRSEQKWRLGCCGGGGGGGGKRWLRRTGIRKKDPSPYASTDASFPVSCLSSGVRVCCSQCSTGLEKEEEPVQNTRRSVKEEGTGQGPRGVGSVEGTARAELGAPLPTSQHIYTHSAMLSKRREKWQGLSGKWLAHVCTRNGGVKGGQKAH